MVDGLEVSGSGGTKRRRLRSGVVRGKAGITLVLGGLIGEMRKSSGLNDKWAGVGGLGEIKGKEDCGAALAREGGCGVVALLTGIAKDGPANGSGSKIAEGAAASGSDSGCGPGLGLG